MLVLLNVYYFVTLGMGINEFCVMFFVFLFTTGEGKLISTDGSIYEGSFHNHRRHGEGKLMFR